MIDTRRESDNSTEATAEYLEIPEESVRGAVRYYAEFRDEVDAWREHVQAIADREEEAWRREQDVLA